MVDAELDDAAVVGEQLGEPRGGQWRTVRVAVVLLEVATHPLAGGVFLTLVGHRYVLLGDERLPRHSAGAEDAEGLVPTPVAVPPGSAVLSGRPVRQSRSQPPAVDGRPGRR